MLWKKFFTLFTTAIILVVLAHGKTGQRNERDNYPDRQPSGFKGASLSNRMGRCKYSLKKLVFYLR